MTLPFQTPGRSLAPVGGRPGLDLSAPAPGAESRNGPPGQPNSAAADIAPGTAGSTTPGGPVLTIHVVGIPAPQGSKRGFVVGNRAVIVDDNKPRLRSWREDVKHAAAGAERLTGPVEVDITFLMRRPKSHYRTGRNAHLLRDNAPRRPATKPDVDKLLRSCLDAMRDAGVYVDDAQVVTLTGRKHYATRHTGAVIYVYTGENG